MMAVPTVAIGCSLLNVVVDARAGPVGQPRRRHAQVVTPAIGRVHMEPSLDHVDRRVEAHDAQRHGDRGGHVVEGHPSRTAPARTKWRTPAAR